MINPIFTCTSWYDDIHQDDGFTASWSPSDKEKQLIEELDGYHSTNIANSHFLRYGDTEAPSAVVDELLFLGNYRHGSNVELLERLKIKHIINVSETDFSERFPQDRYDIVFIPMEDRPITNITQHFQQTSELLHAWHINKEPCLVHCSAGVSRSATIVLAYLIKYHHDTLRNAFLYLISKRSQVRPNDGFLLQLIRYENELRRDNPSDQPTILNDKY